MSALQKGMVIGHNAATVKFICSYGGRIIPRYPDGKLRYHGGETRVLSVHRSVTFSELLLKLGEMCGSPVSLRCQLPTEDLDALVTVTSDEDLANLIEEYDRASPPSLPAIKIRVFFFQPKSVAGKTNSPPSSTASSTKSSSWSSASTMITPRFPEPAKPPVASWQLCLEKSAGKSPHYGCYAHGIPRHIYLIHNGNHWQ